MPERTWLGQKAIYDITECSASVLLLLYADRYSTEIDAIGVARIVRN